MPGHQKQPGKLRFAPAMLSVVVVAAAFAAMLTAMVWQSPRFIDAEVKPLVLEFSDSGTRVQNGWQSPQQDAVQAGASRQGTLDSSAEDVPAGKESISPRVQYFGSGNQPLEPVRTSRNNGSLVLEWVTTEPGRSQSNQSTSDSDPIDLKTQAINYLEEAQAFLKAGDLRRSLRFARLAYSCPVEWQPWETNPKTLLNELEALLKDENVVEAARQAVIAEILATDVKAPASHALLRNQDISDSTPEENQQIGVWGPARENQNGNLPGDKFPGGFHSELVGDITPELTVDQVSGETVSGQSGLELPETVGIDVDPQSAGFATAQDTESAPAEPTRLYADWDQAIANSTAIHSAAGSSPSLELLDRRLQLISDQQAVADRSSSPFQTLTFNVLATLITIFTVLFFGTLLLLLAVLAAGKKLLGGKGVSFRIELVNSPLTVQAGAAAPTAEPAPVPATDELKLDPDFEGILSMGEQRARQRESAILQQFIENNVSLHDEISANRKAA